MLASDAEQTSFKIYKLLNGSIIVLALLTVLEGDALTEWSAMGVILMTLVAHAVSDAFSRALADEIAHKRRPSLAQTGALFGSSFVIVAPGLVPVLAFAAVGAGWLPLGLAFAGACWILVLGLFVAGFVACQLGGGLLWRGLLYGLVISSFGLGIVALRLVFH
ncbi:MAG: hypothetical protein ACT4NV_09740 [Rhodoferax sp.]